MSASLVGSEMCIRDSLCFAAPQKASTLAALCCGAGQGVPVFPGALCAVAVSYTHLTLPTICSV
eukprot:13897524-Alexandrium_andersonii.AAC.1